MEQAIRVADGRTVGLADYGAPHGTAVLWCHGGPGSRLEPAYHRDHAAAAGLRLVGIDRPGYGLSTPRPDRTIGGWVPDALAVADHLGIGPFVTVGVSTGGAYTLATAALAPERVLGVIACGAVTDMRWAAGRAAMSPDHVNAVWDAPDREAALVAATNAYGADGHKLLNGGLHPVLPPSDRATFRDPVWMREAMSAFPANFAQGPVGYTDDRRADGPGWVSFDVASVRCPVIVLHGSRDMLCDVIHAHHTAEIVPDAELRVVEELGHFSIEPLIIPAIAELLARRDDA